MSIQTKEFHAHEGDKVKLDRWATVLKPYYDSKKEYHQHFDEQIDELSSLQRLLYASKTYSLLLIFQGMDAAGKDGVIRHVMSGVNPQGCQVEAFKNPSEEELQHDFLWRTNRALPARGEIGIFNRSYYEEVLVVRVHPEILKKQDLPSELINEKSIWEERYRSIVEMEKHLTRNGTRIVKFFLHLSKDEQRNRFLDRIDEPDKNWKFSKADIEERKYWDKYTEAFQECISATSTKEAPWYIVPADNKENAHLIVSHIIIEKLKELGMAYPHMDKQRIEELQSIRSALLAE